MRKKLPYLYILLFCVLLLLMSLPKMVTEEARGSTVSFFSPLWKGLTSVKELFTSNHSQNGGNNDYEEKLQQLRLENSLLRSEILHFKESIQHEFRLLNRLAAIYDELETKQISSFLKKKHLFELQKLLKSQLQAVPAHVIFRSPASWSSSLWIDVGLDTNKTLGATVVAKNSPVLVGTSVVGIIDYVGNKQSRVRLITDSGLSPSVRALRTPSQNLLIGEKTHALINLIERNKGNLDNAEEKEALIQQLKKFTNNQSTDDMSWYLAKGELHGSSKPLWRTQRHLLNGTGFNYDFADGEGPARDLRTGAPIDSSSDLKVMPILKKGDLLVTTGMDGVFPPDLLVAQVSKVHLLKEGDYFYDLDAVPTAGNLDDLTLVFVIPPVAYDAEEQPPPPGWQ